LAHPADEEGDEQRPERAQIFEEELSSWASRRRASSSPVSLIRSPSSATP
jgi:hypothetical protein